MKAEMVVWRIFPLPEIVKKLWELLDLRFFLILSLCLQAILLLFAPLRLRTKNFLVSFLLWSAYLMAVWTANFAVGIISNSLGQTTNCVDKKAKNYDADVLALWACFLLVHLGGPDTISAFSQEDNELWLRHLAAMVFQSMSALYVFIRSLPDNRLWIPTIFIFIIGLIKYAERTLAFYLASLDTFRESVLPNYAQLVSNYTSMKAANLPVRVHMVPRPVRRTKSVDRPKRGMLTDTEVVLYAYRFFLTFRGLIVDHLFDSHQRDKSRDFFLERDYVDAFKVIEAELNFIYDYFFSKVSVVYSSLGYFLRIMMFGLVVASLGLFYCLDKTSFEDSHDVVVTYTLLIGAIVIDVIAFVKLLTSNWMTTALNELPDVDLQYARPYTRATSKKPSYGYCFQKLRHLLLRPWSESVPYFNLMSYCLNPRPPVKEKIIDFFNLTKFLDGFKYVKHESFPKYLREHIFSELKLKSRLAYDVLCAKEISAAKGDWTLRVEGCTQFLPYIRGLDYDEILLTWHIATELCYHDKVAADDCNKEVDPNKKISKLLSDYMLYLLVRKPEMMTKVAPMGHVRFRDTCAEAKNFFASAFEHKKKEQVTVGRFFNYVCRAFVYVVSLGIIGRDMQRDDPKEKQRQACTKILGVNTQVKPAALKGVKSKSMLFDGCILAKELRKLEDKKKWAMMSKVWVEIMCYAAINGKATVHAQQLNKGGELITIVWLLMVHFGFGDQFKMGGQENSRAVVAVDM